MKPLYNDKPFSQMQSEKTMRFKNQLSALSEQHRQGCIPYRNLCKAFSSDIPLLPVSAFRDHELFSVPKNTIVREVISSGTSGQQPSRIFLDSEAAESQQQVLYLILQDFLGGKRLPMLIIDTRRTISPTADFSARRAGIAGFALFSSSRTWALHEDLTLDIETILRFTEEHRGQKTLLFGFTYMIRQYFTLPLLNAGLHPDFSHSVLIHGGGWKRMTDLSVSPEQFKSELEQAAGIRQVFNYYGMAEQLGSIFMECKYGHLHTSQWSDIQALHPVDFSECLQGEQGILTVSSLLPTSYPGHRILTEDQGRILGEDDCPCGRKGRYFAIDGRVPHAEIRGCSDTFFAATAPISSKDQKIICMAGSMTQSEGTNKSFQEHTLNCLETLSSDLMHDPSCRAFPDIIQFGFWLRRAHLEQLQSRYPEQRRGIGHVLISAPSNMPVLFAYNWAVVLLAGCTVTIRISEYPHPATDLLCKKINALLQLPNYADLYRRTAIIRFPRSDRIFRKLSATADARLLWGGDKTVRKLHGIPAKADSFDLMFPDRYSICILSAESIDSLTDEELYQLCCRFYQDTYDADQNACSSPIIVFWTGESPEYVQNIRWRWWQTLAAIVQKRYHPDDYSILSKYSLLVRQALDIPGLSVRFYAGNLVMTAELPPQWTIDISPSLIPCVPWEMLEARCGLFFEMVLSSLAFLPANLGDKLQTVTVYGFEPHKMQGLLQRSRTYDALRVVSVGEALIFDPVWDGKDLICKLSQPIVT